MSAPVTPTKRPPSAPSTPTGSWRHPALQQIARRQAARSFTSASVLRILVNSGCLIASFLMVDALSSRINITTPTRATPFSWLVRLFFLTLWAARCIFLYNVFHALRPLFTEPDDFSDLALTPDQRKLLGLNPDTPLSASVKPSDFVTPPRYQKSSPPSRSSSPLPRIGAGSGSVGSASVLGSSVTEGSIGSGSLLGAPGSGSPVLTRSPLGRNGGSSVWEGSGNGGSVFRSKGRASGSIGGLVPGSGLASWGVPKQVVAEGNDSPFTGANLNRWAYEKSVFQRKADGIRSPSKGIFSPR